MQSGFVSGCICAPLPKAFYCMVFFALILCFKKKQLSYRIKRGGTDICNMSAGVLVQLQDVHAPSHDRRKRIWRLQSCCCLWWDFTRNYVAGLHAARPRPHTYGDSGLISEHPGLTWITGRKPLKLSESLAQEKRPRGHMTESHGWAALWRPRRFSNVQFFCDTVQIKRKGIYFHDHALVLVQVL